MALYIQTQVEGYVATIPAIVLPEKPQSRTKWLERSEAARLVRAAWTMKQSWKGQPSNRRTGQHIAKFILVGLYTGTRAGAICRASFQRLAGHGYIDLDRGVFCRRPDNQKETNKRRPPVRLPDRLLAHLGRWACTQTYVVEWNGKPVKSVKKGFKAACEKAGLGWYEDEIFKTEVTPHVLRHTAATWLMQAGASLTEAADYLRMTEAVLRSIYYHVHPDFQAYTANRITAKPKGK